MNHLKLLSISLGLAAGLAINAECRVIHDTFDNVLCFGPSQINNPYCDCGKDLSQLQCIKETHDWCKKHFGSNDKVTCFIRENGMVRCGCLGENRHRIR